MDDRFEYMQKLQESYWILYNEIITFKKDHVFVEDKLQNLSKIKEISENLLIQLLKIQHQPFYAKTKHLCEDYEAIDFLKSFIFFMNALTLATEECNKQHYLKELATKNLMESARLAYRCLITE